MPSATISPEFCSLSDEVLLRILSHARPKELIRLRQTCRRLKSLLAEPRIWERLLLKDYDFPRESYWLGWSAENIYKAVYKFRELLGFWFCDLCHFGMVVHVRLVKDGIVAYDCSPPLDDYVLDANGVSSSVVVNPDVNFDDSQRLHRFRFRRLFALTPVVVAPQSNCYQLRFVCYHSPNDAHLAQDAAYDVVAVESTCNGSESAEKPCLRKTDTGFEFTCANQANHGPHDVRYWIEWEHGFRPINDDEQVLENILSVLRNEKDYDLRLEKFDVKATLDSYRLTRRMDHLLAPSTSSIAFVACPPGLYFGHFSWHGWEVINLYYTDDGGMLMGEKVTGDQMIPVGRTSFRVNLRQRIHLSFADQTSMASVRAAVKRFPALRLDNGLSASRTVNGHSDPSSPSSPSVSTYPFRVPSDCTVLGASTVPDQCSAFFMAEGQIAFPNFCNPRYLPCVFVVFDQTVIGLLWLDLRCFMPMYKMISP